MRALKILFFWLLMCVATNAAGTKSLDGAWDFRKVSGVFTFSDIARDDGEVWREIRTPANWYKEGIDHAGTAIYRKSFQMPALGADSYAYITFHGVDYAADVWINGHHIGAHKGYFQKFDFEISDHLTEGENTIHVAVHSPKEDVSTVWSLKKQLIKGIFSHHDTRPGGAWSERGQEKNTGGIWAPVEIKWGRGGAISDLKLTPSVLDDGAGELAVDFAVETAGNAVPKSAIIRISPANFRGRSISVERSLKPQKDKRYRLKIAQQDIALWYPFEYGAPNLYSVDITIADRRGEMDSAQRTIAYRTVERDTQNGFWFINGQRIFLRGTNYIPTQWLSEMSVADYENDLSLMRVANINTVRVHAHIGAKEFYDAADRSGMMIWQDFPLQWGYEDTPQFLAEAKRQAYDMVAQFNDHPSIIAWSMQNEPPWDADWMKYKYDDYDPEQNKELTAGLYETVLALDTTRYTHAHSATAEHPWLGWYSGKWTDYAKQTDQNLVTEFGAQALPVLSSLRRIFPQESIWPDSDEDWALWSYHNFQKHETTIVAGVSIGNDLSSFIDNTQTYQARLTKFAAENLRRQKYAPVGGIFQFMFNEDWPSVNWGIVDYWRVPKPGYHALKTAYQPVLGALFWDMKDYAKNDAIEFDVWIINDLAKTHRDVQFQIELRTPSGDVDHIEYDIDIAADSAEKIGLWQYRLREAGEHTIVLRVLSKTAETLSVNDYSVSVAP